MSKADVKMLKQLVSSLEDCVESKDEAQYHEACKLIGVTTFGSGGKEAAVLRRMALANDRLYCDDAVVRGRADDTFTFEYAPVGSSTSLALDMPDADLFTDRTLTISCDAESGTTW